jgi:PAS domain S-box-containing protein
LVAEDERTTASGEPFAMEYRLLDPDRRTVWVHDESALITDHEGRPRFWQGVMVDITERKATQRALEEAEAKYRSLVERLPGVTYTFPNPTMPYDSSYNYVSPQITDLLGCEPSAWLADETAWRAFVHADDVDGVEARWRDAGARGEAFDIEYRMVARDGHIVWVREQSAPVRDDHGIARFWQGDFTDISEQREAREALTAAFEQEREISRRFRVLDEMKNMFLAAVSHELRTPLAAILGLALTLEREELDLGPEESRELLRRLASNARKLNRLLSDLLDLDRLGRGIVEPRLRPTDVAALVRQVVENSDAIEVRRPHLDLDPVTADVDPAKVERIVENLLANAVRYTPADAAIWVRLRPRGAGVLISVDDEGPGIPEELHAAVFEPFRQVPGRNEHAPGVGIGLSLVARFAELHGGRAWVEAREGGGSSFRVLLPGTPPDGSTPATPLMPVTPAG